MADSIKRNEALTALDGLTFKRIQIAASDSCELTFPAKSNQGIIFTSGVDADVKGLSVFHTISSGAARMPVKLAGAASVTFAVNSNTLTITNGSTYSMMLVYMVVAGELPDIVGG